MDKQYIVAFTKKTSGLGEDIAVSVMLPGESTEDDLSTELIKMSRTVDERMRDLNKEVLKLTGKNLEKMGIW